jgi:hypothetical protein
MPQVVQPGRADSADADAGGGDQLPERWADDGVDQPPLCEGEEEGGVFGPRCRLAAQVVVVTQRANDGVVQRNESGLAELRFSDQ